METEGRGVSFHGTGGNVLLVLGLPWWQRGEVDEMTGRVKGYHQVVDDVLRGQLIIYFLADRM